MRTIVFSMLLVASLTLTVQSLASAENNKDSTELELTRSQLATTTRRSAVPKVNGRNGGGMMMNMSDAVGHGSKGKDDSLDKMYKLFMICQTLVTTALSFVDPVIKVKNFGLSVITTLIAVAKFIMDLKNSKEKQKKSPWESENTILGADRIGMAYATPYRPAYIAPYPTYMQKYRLPS